MAFIKRRKTRSGGVSTALVEAYRDADGRPRQRILANLYGAVTPLEALAMLAAQRELLRKEKIFRQTELDDTAETYMAITMGSLQGYRFSPAERKEADRFLSARGRVSKRLEKIEAAVARIQKDGAVIRQHCDASPAEVQAAIQLYKKQLSDAEAGAVGAAYIQDEMKKKLRRLSPWKL